MQSGNQSKIYDCILLSLEEHIKNVPLWAIDKDFIPSMVRNTPAIIYRETKSFHSLQQQTIFKLAIPQDGYEETYVIAYWVDGPIMDNPIVPSTHYGYRLSVLDLHTNKVYIVLIGIEPVKMSVKR